MATPCCQCKCAQIYNWDAPPIIASPIAQQDYLLIQNIIAYWLLLCSLLREWLTTIGLLDYLPYFKVHRITAAQAKKELNNSLLRKMSITDGQDQKTLLDNVSKIAEIEDTMFSSQRIVQFAEGDRDALTGSSSSDKKDKEKEGKRPSKHQHSNSLPHKPERTRKAHPGTFMKERGKQIGSNLRDLESRFRSDNSSDKNSNVSAATDDLNHKLPSTASDHDVSTQGAGAKRLRSNTFSSDKMSDTSPIQTQAGNQAAKRRWEIRSDQIIFGDTIGEGGSGYVVKGEWRGIPVAVKKLREQAMRKDQVDMFIAEIDMMSELRHPHIIQFLGACLENGDTFFITQLAEKGNLHDCIVKENPGWRRRVQFARDIARGMNYLHQNEPPILHRDLKSMNVLIDENYKALLCDFGISRQIQDTGTNLARRGLVSGTYLWTAPDDKVTTKSDVYSYGLVMWEILTGAYPFERYNLSQLIINVHTKGERPEIPNEAHIDPNYIKLMQRCWDSDPDIRPSFAEILKVLDYLYETAEPSTSCSVTPSGSTVSSPLTSPFNTNTNSNSSAPHSNICLATAPNTATPQSNLATPTTTTTSSMILTPLNLGQGSGTIDLDRMERRGGALHSPNSMITTPTSVAQQQNSSNSSIPTRPITPRARLVNSPAAVFASRTTTS